MSTSLVASVSAALQSRRVVALHDASTRLSTTVASLSADLRTTQRRADDDAAAFACERAQSAARAAGDGLARAGATLYASDDTGQDGWLAAFSAADVDAAVAARGPPSRVFATSVVNIAYTASHVSFDNDPTTPRIWVAEHFVTATNVTPMLPVKNGKSSAWVPDPAWNETGDGASDVASLVGFPVDPTTGALLGAAGGIAVPDTVLSIGPHVTAALFGYTEYPGGPQFFTLQRCALKPGFECKIEWHEPPLDGGRLVVGGGAKAASAVSAGSAQMMPDVAATDVSLLVQGQPQGLGPVERGAVAGCGGPPWLVRQPVGLARFGGADARGGGERGRGRVTTMQRAPWRNRHTQRI